MATWRVIQLLISTCKAYQTSNAGHFFRWNNTRALGQVRKIYTTTLCLCNIHVVYFYSFLSTFYDLFVTNLISILWLGSFSPKHSLNFLRDLVFIYVHMQRLWEKKIQKGRGFPLWLRDWLWCAYKDLDYCYSKIVNMQGPY